MGATGACGGGIVHKVHETSWHSAWRALWDTLKSEKQAGSLSIRQSTRQASTQPVRWQCAQGTGLNIREARHEGSKHTADTRALN